MTDVEIKKYQTKPARVDVLILTEENAEEVAKLMQCERFDIRKNVATGDISVFFQFPTDPPLNPRRYDFTAHIGSPLVYEYENENPHWDLVPSGLLDRLDSYEEDPVEYNFNPPYDN